MNGATIGFVVPIGGAGAFLMVAGSLMLARRLPLAIGGARAIGRITGIRRHAGPAGGETRWRTTQSRIVSFRDADGAEHAVALGQTSRYPRQRLGDAVAVVYDRRNPTRAVEDSAGTLVVFPLVTTMAGLALLVLAAGMAFGGTS